MRIALLALLATFFATPAFAQTAVWDDSLDAATLTSPTQVAVCPCYCQMECFGSTFTAPTDLTVNYIYLLYGTVRPINVLVDMQLRVNPTQFSPGDIAVNVVNENVAAPFPVNNASSEFFEIGLVQSGIQPVTIPSGDEFSVTFCYDFGEDDGFEAIVPNDGHGPVYDQDGVQGTSWVYAWQPTVDELLQGLECPANGSQFAWKTDLAPGDWVIRVSDSPIDWLAPPGDDDDDDDSTEDPSKGDDDDAADDDDVADDDDATEAEDLVVFSVTPAWQNEGESIPIAINGQGFDITSQVFIGGLAASNIVVQSGNRLDAVTPPTLAASDIPYDVQVNSATGSSTLPRAFEVRAVDEGGDGCNCGGGGAAWLFLLAPLGIRRRR